MKRITIAKWNGMVSFFGVSAATFQMRPAHSEHIRTSSKVKVSSGRKFGLSALSSAKHFHRTDAKFVSHA